MINEAFQILHLQERKITTPLFNNAKEAFIGEAYGHKFHSKYLVIESNKHLDDQLFREGNICPIFIYQNKSYIFQEGESLYTYFLARKQTDIVLCEEQIWKLLAQISKAILVLRTSGYEHRHIKQYAIRRLGPDNFKLVFHPNMRTAQELIKQGNYGWFQFYLAPEQLTNITHQQFNSCVFSLGALILNIMNPLDFRRDIYSKKELTLNLKVLQQKISNAELIYSPKIMQLLKKMLIESSQKRITLEELIRTIDYANPIQKKMQMTTNIKEIVNAKLTKSKEKSNSPPRINYSNHKVVKSSKKQEEKGPKVIKFQRGTFGGHDYDQSGSEKEDFQSSKPEVKKNQPYTISKQDKDIKTLIKTGSENPSNFLQKPSQRSYSQYITTQKKMNNSSPESKASQQNETKAPSGKIKVDINIFTQEEDPSVKNLGFNEYMNRTNQSKKLNFKLTSPKTKDQKYREQENKTWKQQKEDEKISEENNRENNKILVNDSETESHHCSDKNINSKAEDDHVSESVQQFKSRVSRYLLTLSECLEEPSTIARKLGYQGVWINGNVYYGQFKNGRRNGLALQVFQSNQYYYGYYRDDMFHGEGFYFWNNNEHFLGIFEAGTKKEGTWCGKNKYIGEIKDNKRHGIGTYIYSNGSMYEGQWFLGKRHGSGIIIEPTGEKFMGTFKMGKKWGHGSFLVNGCRINGVWNGQQAVGPCQILYEDGRAYIGKINQDFQMHGEGELRFSTGSICKGQFVKDNFVFGEMLYRNGERYVGQVKEMRRHGKGTYTYLGGKQRTGEWKDNILISNDTN